MKKQASHISDLALKSSDSFRENLTKCNLFKEFTSLEHCKKDQTETIINTIRALRKYLSINLSNTANVAGNTAQKYNKLVQAKVQARIPTQKFMNARARIQNILVIYHCEFNFLMKTFCLLLNKSLEKFYKDEIFIKNEDIKSSRKIVAGLKTFDLEHEIV